MVWAVLAGSERLSRVLWAKSHEPLRAAIICSQLCRRLSALPHLRADEEHLDHFADMYEDWAIGLLDAVPDSKDAVPLLTLVPTAQADPRFEKLSAAGSQLLWTKSPLDCASEGQGRLSAPCRRFVAHRHSRFLLDAYFCGDFPTSRACIPARTPLWRIVLQMFVFFIPGVFCEVMPSHYELRLKAKKKEDQEDQARRERGLRGRARKVKKSLHVGGSMCRHTIEGAMTMASAAVNTTVHAAGNLGGAVGIVGKHDEEMEEWDDEYVQVSRDNEDTLTDLVDDIKSVRFLFFFQIPKIKLIGHLISHAGFFVFLWVLCEQGAEQLRNEREPEITTVDLVFWVWTFARLVAELQEIVPFSREGVSRYFQQRQKWMDPMIVLLVGSAVAIKLRVNDCLDASGGVLIARDGCDTLDARQRRLELSRIAHDLLALALVPVCFRLLEYAIEVSEAVGVLVIILSHMLSDGFNFAFVLLLTALGVGATLRNVMPTSGSMSFVTGSYPYTGHFSQPMFLPFWGLVGDIELDHFEEMISALVPTQFLAPLLLWMYLVIANIFLVNLLIATMTATYERVKNQSQLYWNFERTAMILQFKDTKSLPPPLNLLVVLFYTLPHMVLRLVRCGPSRVFATEEVVGYESLASHRAGFRAVPSARSLRQLRGRETDARRSYLGLLEKRRKAELHSSVGRLQEGLGELHAASRERHESSLAAMARSQERHEERLDELATQVAAIAKKLGIESEDAKPKDHRNPDFMRRRSMV